MCLCQLWAFTGCVDPIAENKPEEELLLKASTENVVLSQQSEQDEALKLSWGAGSNHGTGSAIHYILEMITKLGFLYGDIYLINLIEFLLSVVLKLECLIIMEQ